MTEQLEQRSDAWHAARAGRITASNVGAILGHAPYANRYDVMRRMVRAAAGAPSEFSGNIATEYGNQNEDGALIEYRMETGNDVQKVGFVTREDWAGCSPDGLLLNLGGLEIKCPFGKRKDVDPVFKTLREQPHYYDQVQFSLWVTMREFWHFYQWTPGATKLEYVEPDRDWQNENLPKLRQFYAEYLEAVKAPDEYMSPRRVLIDTAQAAMMLEEWDTLTEAAERAANRKKEILDQLVMMAGNSNAEVCGRKLTEVKKEGAVSYAKALKAIAPDADLEPYRGKPSTFWKLT